MFSAASIEICEKNLEPPERGCVIAGCGPACGAAATWWQRSLSAAASVPALLGWRFLVASAGSGDPVDVAGAAGSGPGRDMDTAVLLGLTQAAVLFLETFGVARTQASNAGLIISPDGDFHAIAGCRGSAALAAAAVFCGRSGVRGGGGPAEYGRWLSQPQRWRSAHAGRRRWSAPSM